MRLGSDVDEIHRLRLELAAMTARLNALEGSTADDDTADSDAAPRGDVSRRHLLRALGGAAAAGVGIAIGGDVIAPSPAAAYQFFDSNNADPAIECRNIGTGPALRSLMGIDNPAFSIVGQGTAGGAASFTVSGTSATAAAVFAQHNGDGPAIQAELTKSTNSDPVISATTNGTGSAFEGTVTAGSNPVFVAHQNGSGNAVLGEITNSSNASSALRGHTSGTGRGVLAQITNANNANAAVEGNTNGTGRAVLATTTGTGSAIRAQINNGTSTADVLDVTTNGRGRGLKLENTSTTNPASLLFASTNGLGGVASFNLSNSQSDEPAVSIGTIANGGALVAEINGSSSGDAVFVRTFGTGRALFAQIQNANSPATAVTLQTDGSGTAVQATSASGLGVTAQGGKAPLRLMPASIVGPPTSGVHSVGEVFVDSDGTLFHAKRATALVNPFRWLRVGYTAIDPTRIVDTRANRGPVSHNDQPLGPDEEFVVPIVGVAGIPEGASAVTLNITAISPTTDGFLSLYPANLSFNASSRPTFANANFAAGQVINNLATIKINTTSDPNRGAIKVFNFKGNVHITIDIAGFHS